jgi:hypothetical protein
MKIFLLAIVFSLSVEIFVNGAAMQILSFDSIPPVWGT